MPNKSINMDVVHGNPFADKVAKELSEEFLFWVAESDNPSDFVAQHGYQGQEAKAVIEAAYAANARRLGLEKLH
ncbi:MAG: hypothetical protein AAF549_07830 [Pseudomonadota bacterium]